MDSKLQPTETAKFFQTHHIDEIFHQAVGMYKGFPLPLEIEISLIDRCNRHCHFCPRGDDSIAPDTDLRIQPELYLKLAKELKEIGYKGLIMLSGLGEPTLYKDICSVIKAFNFTYVNVNSNGDVLTRKKIQDMIDAGLYKLLISIYEPENWDRLKELQMGFEDHVTIRNRYDDQDKLFNNRAGSLYRENRGGMCYYPFYLMMVDCDGTTYPCCHEWTRRLKMGNLYQRSFWQIWTSSDYRRVRKKILEGNRDLYPCRECNVNGTFRGKQNFDTFTEVKNGKRSLKQEF